MLPYPQYLLLPLGASLGYAVTAASMKRALAEGGDVWRLAGLCNLTMAVAYLPLLLLAETPSAGAAWYQPLLPAGTFTLGMLFNGFALSRGDVSVATPLLGSKTVLVAFLSVVLLGQAIPLAWWAAAVLVFVALLVMRSGRLAASRRFWPTVGFAVASSFFFALTDVLFQKFAGLWGIGWFVPLVFGAVAVSSLTTLPLFPSRASAGPFPWRWALAGAGLNAVQGFCMAFLFSTVPGSATPGNIVYSARGVWSVLLVWLAGRWFASDERHETGGVMGRRLGGAVLILVAIGLVLLAGP